MSFALDQYTGNGVLTNFTVTFPYLAQSHVEVRVAGVLQTITTHYTFLNATTIQFVSAPANGAAIEFKRSSNRTARLVDHQDASTVTAETLDQDANQVFYVAQEAFDASDNSIQLDSDGKFNAESKVIKNVANPTDAQDAASKDYVDLTLLGGSPATPLAVGSGGTGAVTAAGARASLDVPSNADLDAEEAARIAADALKAPLASPALTGTPTAPTAAADTNTTQLATTAFVMGQLSRRNAIINGAFDIWQRGVSLASISNGAYLPDRWKYNLAGTTAVHAASRSTDVPSVALAGRLFNYSYLLDCTTADGTIAAADFISLEQRIEGYNWLPFAQRACTLSFLVKATKTGTYCVSFRNTGNDQCYIAEYTVNASATWEKKTISLPASPSGGTWDYTNGEGLKLAFIIAAGTDHHGTAGAWSGSNKLATVNQVNGVDNVANDFRITGVQLEVGSVATGFEVRAFAEEVEMCQRYYEKSYNLTVAPGTVDTDGCEALRNVGGAQDCIHVVNYKTRKRANANSLQVYSTVTGASGNWRDISSGTDRAVNVETNGEANLSVRVTNVSAGGFMRGHWIVDAEL